MRLALGHAGAMRNRLIPLAAMLLALMPMGARAEPLHPALWKVTRGPTTIWLFGTIHMLPKGADWLNGAVASAVDGSGELATEIDDPDGTATRAALAAHGALKPGESLSAMLPPRERVRLARRLASFGQPADRFEHSRPWFAAVALSALPVLKRGFDPADGVEAGLNRRTAGRSIVRVGIETPEQQLGLFDTLPRRTQIRYLTSVIDHFPEIDHTIDAMVAAWGKGDAPALARLMNQDEGQDDPLLTRRLILDRNLGFARWIKGRLTQPGSVFVAVGAGHLAGRGSVQADLAAMGIKVERVQ